MASAFKPKPKRAKKPSRIDRHCFEEMVLAQISDVQAEEFIKESSDLMSKATWAMSEIKTQLTALTAVSTAAPDTTVKNTSQSKLPHFLTSTAITVDGRHSKINSKLLYIVASSPKWKSKFILKVCSRSC